MAGIIEKYGGPEKTKLGVSRVNLLQISVLITIGIFSSLLIFFFLNFIKSDFPMIDAFRTSFSWMALWLAINKKQEHWFFG